MFVELDRPCTYNRSSQPSGLFNSYFILNRRVAVILGACGKVDGYMEATEEDGRRAEKWVPGDQTRSAGTGTGAEPERN